MSDVMKAGFVPETRGRPPLIDPEPVIRKLNVSAETYGLVDGEYRWVKFSTYSEREIRSLKRQLMPRGYDTVINREDKVYVLYARRSVI